MEEYYHPRVSREDWVMSATPTVIDYDHQHSQPIQNLPTNQPPAPIQPPELSSFNDLVQLQLQLLNNNEQNPPEVKRLNLSTAQRREAIKAKLRERGEAFDPAKFRRGKKKKKLKRTQESVASGTKAEQEAESWGAKHFRGSMHIPLSSEIAATNVKSGAQGSKEVITLEKSGSSHEGVSYRDISIIKMAIFLEDYPEAKLSAEQGEFLEDAIMDKLQPLEDGSTPSFSGTYMENGALIISCTNYATRRWLESLIPRVKPFGEQVNLKIGLRKDILRLRKVFFRAHPKLLRKAPDQILEMLGQQNPTLKVREWRIHPVKSDPRGYGFVCFLSEACYDSVKLMNFKANLGLWQVSFVTATSKDHTQSPTKGLQPSKASSAALASSSSEDLMWHSYRNQGRVTGLGHTKDDSQFISPHK